MAQCITFQVSECSHSYFLSEQLLTSYVEAPNEAVEAAVMSRLGAERSVLPVVSVGGAVLSGLGLATD